MSQTSFLRETSIYASRVSEFSKTDWTVYVVWIGLMYGLFFAVMTFLLAGHMPAWNTLLMFGIYQSEFLFFQPRFHLIRLDTEPSTKSICKKAKPCAITLRSLQVLQAPCFYV